MRRPIVIDWREHRLHFGARTLIMGVLNVTPDSFSDGGDFATVDAAVSAGRRMVEQGVDILDIGGMSSRPGSIAGSVDEEIRRVVPVVETLAEEVSVPLSIDSWRPQAIQAALDAGASIINDITGLQGDRRVAEIAARSHVPVIAMHMRGTPENMQDNPVYDDVVEEVRAFLARSVEIAVGAGLPREFVIADPGIGFGKTPAHNRALFQGIDRLLDLDQGLLFGPSRKGFLTSAIGNVPARDRDAATLAAVLHAAAQGVHIVRVHNVEMARQALAVQQWLAATGRE